MSALPSKSAVSILTSRNVVIVSLLTSLLYLLTQIYFFNHSLISHTLLGTFPIEYKFRLTWDLFIGYFLMFPLSEVLFNLLTALLVGWSLALTIAMMQRMKDSGQMKFSVGGVGMVALMRSGCPGCGLTLLSFLGPSTGALAVTLHNPGMQFLILGVLIFSVIYSLKKLEESLVCKIG